MKKRKKKNKSNIPKQKRLNRNSRLKIGKQWIYTFEGQNIVKSYSRYFNVDKLCAAIELEMLGQKVYPEYIKQLKANVEGQRRAREKKKRLEEERKRLELYEDSDDTSYFIAGYTSGGMPYGITWEEYEREENGIEEQALLEEEYYFDEEPYCEENISFEKSHCCEKHKLEYSMNDEIPF